MAAKPIFERSTLLKAEPSIMIGIRRQNIFRIVRRSTWLFAIETSFSESFGIIDHSCHFKFRHRCEPHKIRIDASGCSSAPSARNQAGRRERVRAERHLQAASATLTSEDPWAFEYRRARHPEFCRGLGVNTRKHMPVQDLVYADVERCQFLS